MDLYLDIFFLENLVMNYFILLITAKFAKIRATGIRLLLGSLVGTGYAIFLILFPGIRMYYSIFAKILLSLVIVAISFSPEKLRSFIKVLVMFYISTFIFAGAALSFVFFNQSGGFVKNGIVYFFGQSKLLLLMLSILTAGIIIKVFWELLQYRLTKDTLLIPLKISFENKITDIDALVDTGNSLYDPLTNMPVVIVEFKALKDMLPDEIQTIYEEAKEHDLCCVTDIVAKSSWFSRFRLIPFTSLGKDNGILIGFKPDYIQIGGDEGKKDVSDVIVGIYNRTLSRNRRYRALLNPELV